MGKNAQMAAPNFQLNINVKELSSIVCKGTQGPDKKPCASIYFLPVVELRVAPALLTGMGKDTIVPIQAFRCIECGAIITITDPDPAIEGRARSS